MELFKAEMWNIYLAVHFIYEHMLFSCISSNTKCDAVLRHYCRSFDWCINIQTCLRL